MGTLNRQELDHLERRELQLTILAAVFVLVLAGGLAAFMYPLCSPPSRNSGRSASPFRFLRFNPSFVGYLLERQRTVRSSNNKSWQSWSATSPCNNKRAWICCTPCPI